MPNTFDPALLAIGAIIAFILVPVIALINREHWTGAQKAVCAFICCLATGIFLAWFERQLDWHDIRNCIIIVFSFAIFFYNHFFSPSGISDKLEKAV